MKKKNAKKIKDMKSINRKGGNYRLAINKEIRNIKKNNDFLLV
jgi:hypothetical protein